MIRLYLLIDLTKLKLHYYNKFDEKAARIVKEIWI